MKKIKIIALVLLLLLGARCVIGILLCVPDIITYASKKAINTKATVVGMEVDSIIVSYSTDSKDIITKVPKDLSLGVLKIGDEIDVTYDKDNETRTINMGPTLLGNIFGLAIVYSLIGYSIWFVDIISKFQSKKWDSMDFEYAGTKIANEMVYAIDICSGEEGKKKIESVYNTSNIIEILVENKIMDKVPVKVNPKNKNQKLIDYQRIEELVDINKSLVQL